MGMFWEFIDVAIDFLIYSFVLFFIFLLCEPADFISIEFCIFALIESRINLSLKKKIILS